MSYIKTVSLKDAAGAVLVFIMVLLTDTVVYIPL